MAPLISLTLLASLALSGASSAQDAPQATPAATSTSSVRLNPDTLRQAFGTALIESTTRESVPARQKADVKARAAEGRACEGCPRRRVWAAYLQTAIINAIYIAAHGPDDPSVQIGFNSWWTNLKYGFEWDGDTFRTNQFGHPYQGNNYYTGGRANGLSYWESAAVAAFGSLTWEYFAETNYPSFNDFVNTTLGGVAMGETLHRLAWMIRNPEASGRSRLWREIAATAVDPIGGANRFISGEAARVSEKPRQFVPSTTVGFLNVGALWQGDNAQAFSESGQAFLEMDLAYGQLLQGRSRDPFEAFTVNLRTGGGGVISDARVRGRLLGQPLSEDGRVHLAVTQSYDYVANDAYEFGRQGFDGFVSTRWSLGSRTEAVLRGGGGLTALGAIDRVSKPATPEEDVEGGARTYDYGPGTTFGGAVTLLRNGQRFGDVSYQGYQIYVVDGVRSNHVLQRVRLDLLVPVHRRVAIGATGEFFYRKTYFPRGGEASDGFPQARFYLALR